jgi:hypothetical protein
MTFLAWRELRAGPDTIAKGVMDGYLLLTVITLTFYQVHIMNMLRKKCLGAL